MRIFLASDIHFEFSNAIDWLPPLPAGDQFDVLVLAGDIGSGPFLGVGLRRLRKKFPSIPIVLVAGNHDHYHKAINRELMEGIDVPNVYFLENNSVDLLGYRFLGTTLWTGFDCMGEPSKSRAMHLAQNSIADFMVIRSAELSGNSDECQHFTPADMAALHIEARAWLTKELAACDPDKTIVVTHFPPAREYRHELIREDLLSAYFQANCSDLIRQFQPALWMYGHNHYSNSHQAGKTLVVSNQYGYPGESTGYRSDWIIKL